MRIPQRRQIREQVGRLPYRSRGRSGSGAPVHHGCAVNTAGRPADTGLSDAASIGFQCIETLALVDAVSSLQFPRADGPQAWLETLRDGRNRNRHVVPEKFRRLNMAPGQCNICASPLGQPVYRSANNASITTMNKIIPGRTEVFFCGACGHLQTTELPNLDAYYATEYEINFASEDDDQLYKVIDGRPVYRAEHQANVLLRKLHFGAGHRVLDYGCAKAATLRKVATAHTDIVPYAFDVTDKYVPAWKRFIAAGHWATHRVPAVWDATIDIVLSFYALEHVRDPRDFLRTVRRVLKPGGTFYFVVPDTYANVADFVVADHINHFSESSLRTMLELAGF